LFTRGNSHLATTLLILTWTLFHFFSSSFFGVTGLRFSTLLGSFKMLKNLARILDGTGCIRNDVRVAWEGGLITGDAGPVPVADNRGGGESRAIPSLLPTSLGEALQGSAITAFWFGIHVVIGAVSDRELQQSDSGILAL